ncbi:MAG: hypothetical protein RIS35_2475 [Pseudomonadota bacterium]
MLTQFEQDAVIAQVREIVRHAKIREVRVRRQEMSPKAAKAAFERALDRLRDSLKEIG